MTDNLEQTLNAIEDNLLATERALYRLNNGGRVCLSCYKIKPPDAFPYPNAPCCMKCKHGEEWGE